MKLKLHACLAFLLAVGAARVGFTQPDFLLSFDTPEQVEGEPLELLRFNAFGVLTPSGDSQGSGAQGWSVSISSIGCAVTAATTSGTAGGDVGDEPPGLRNTGFEVSELTENARPDSQCEGRGGAVSAVVLSFTMPIELPTDEPSRIIALELEGPAPAEGECAPCALEYVEGCQGSGQPVNNAVTWQGQTIRPSVSSATTQICGLVDPTCPRDGQVGLVMSAEGSNTQSAEVAQFQRGKENLEVVTEVRSGETGESTVYAAIASNNLGSGVQGWSVAAAVTDGLALAATTEGTVGGDVNDQEPGLRNTGFEVSELIDPATNAQGQGAVSAVVLSFTMPVTLEPTGTATILALTVGTVGPVEGEPTVVNISWQDGLRGGGQPVSNVATLSGTTVRFCGCQNASVTFIPKVAVPFIRCDPNDDGESNLADAVYLVNALFRGGPEIGCADAGDCNADAQVDLSDATYAVAYRFLGGSPPPAPFPDCGEIEDAPLGCDDYSSCP